MSATAEPLSYTALTKLSAEEAAALLAESSERAARVAEAAAKYGILEAQSVYAQMLLEGCGVARDPVAAFCWFKVAAASGRADLLNLLGRCYERGWGTAADPGEAARLYERAAALGDAWAQFNLAGMVRTGDPRRALSLYVRAARQGLGKAMTMIGEMVEPEKPRSALLWYRRGAERGDFRAHAALARRALADGDAEAALPHLEFAVGNAFPAFNRLIGDALAAHSDPRVAEWGRRALQRAAEHVEPSYAPVVKPRPRRRRRIFHRLRLF